jgi:hypothetical protein
MPIDDTAAAFPTIVLVLRHCILDRGCDHVHLPLSRGNPRAAQALPPRQTVKPIKMKGALGLIAIASVVWVFWMTWEWLRNRHRGRKS